MENKNISLLCIGKQAVESNDIEPVKKIIPMFSDEFYSRRLCSTALDKLLDKHDLDNALEIAVIQADQFERDSLFSYICNIAIKIDRLEKALEAANEMSNETKLKWISLNIIYRAFIEKHQYDKAVDIANSMPTTRSAQRDEILDEISNELVKEGNRDKAVEVAHMISDKSRRELVVDSIVNGVY